MRAGLALLAALVAVPVTAAPIRIASLNLCTDEYLLALGLRGQVASISRLGADGQESPLAPLARGLATNSGRLGDLLATPPDLVLTMGAAPQDKALAARLGIRFIALPYPASVDDVVAQMRAVSRLAGAPQAGDGFAQTVARLRATAPPTRPGLMIGGSGLAPAQAGLTAQWLRLAGVSQQAGGSIALERLLASPPPLLIINRYRPGQRSAAQGWTAHPALARLPAATRRLEADGRAFLCGGAAMPAEIARLKKALAA